MTRSGWGGISLGMHAALLIILLRFAHAARIDASATPVSHGTTFILVATPSGAGGAGGGASGAARSRPARMPATRPVDVTVPHALSRVEPPAIAALPMIPVHDVDFAVGAPMAIEGTATGPGEGNGSRNGRGPRIGPGDGPGVGDIYEPGVGGVSNPTLIHEVRPNFTTDAVRARTQGVVVLQVIVRADGSVDPAGIRITRSLDSGLDQEAVVAVRQWRFRPSMRLGHPVASRVVVELSFEVR